MNYIPKYKNVHDENIIMMYRGGLSFELISTILHTLEERINEYELDRRTQKKFYSLATECIQNVYYHNEKMETDDVSITEYNSKSTLIMVTAKKRFYSLVTCNFVSNEQADILRNKIDRINSFNEEDLRIAYRTALQNGEFSSKNTAGLGFIDIARKSGSKLSYEISKVNDECSYFSFEVRLNK